MDKQEYQELVTFETQRSMGCDFNVPVAVSTEAYDTLANKEGAAKDSANSNTTYRSTLPKVRDRFADVVEAFLTEKYPNLVEGDDPEELVLRKTKEVSKGEDNEDVDTVFDESANEYLKRILKVIGSPGNPAPLQPCVDQVNEELKVGEYTDENGTHSIKFDPSGKERGTAGPKKVAKTYVKIATDIVNSGKGEQWAELWSQKLGFNIEPSIEGIGRAIAENERRKREALKQAGEYDL